MPQRDWLNISPKLGRGPLSIAACGGAIGLISGALFAGVLAKPSQRIEVAAATIAASPPKQAETTGASPREAATPPAIDATASVATESKQADVSSDCERQAWPYITQQCQAEREAGQRKVRVITTDRLAAPVVNAIEKQSPPRARVEGRPVPLVALAPEAKADAPAVAVEQPEPSVSKANTPEPVAASAAPETSAPVAVVLTPKQQRAAARTERRKALREAREQRRLEARTRKNLHDEDVSEENTRRVSRRGEPRRGRIVERWTEREYDVRAEDGSGRRTVVVRGHGLSYAPEADMRQSNPLFPIFGN